MNSLLAAANHGSGTVLGNVAGNDAALEKLRNLLRPISEHGIKLQPNDPLQSRIECPAWVILALTDILCATDQENELPVMEPLPSSFLASEPRQFGLLYDIIETLWQTMARGEPILSGGYELIPREQETTQWLIDRFGPMVFSQHREGSGPELTDGYRQFLELLLLAWTGLGTPIEKGVFSRFGYSQRSNDLRSFCRHYDNIARLLKAGKAEALDEYQLGMLSWVQDATVERHLYVAGYIVELDSASIVEQGLRSADFRKYLQLPGTERRRARDQARQFVAGASISLQRVSEVMHALKRQYQGRIAEPLAWYAVDDYRSWQQEASWITAAVLLATTGIPPSVWLEYLFDLSRPYPPIPLLGSSLARNCFRRSHNHELESTLFTVKLEASHLLNRLRDGVTLETLPAVLTDARYAFHGPFLWCVSKYLGLERSMTEDERRFAMRRLSTPACRYVYSAAFPGVLDKQQSISMTPRRLC